VIFPPVQVADLKDGFERNRSKADGKKNLGGGIFSSSSLQVISVDIFREVKVFEGKS
jgi:hypothetical protein